MRLHPTTGNAVIDQEVESRFYEFKQTVIQERKVFVGLSFQLKLISRKIEMQNTCYLPDVPKRRKLLIVSLVSSTMSPGAKM